MSLLNYLVLLQRIFALEYLMGRNNSPGLDVLEMEDHVLTGRQYWDKKESADEQLELSLSDRVINRIVTKRRARIDLAEDLNMINERLRKMNDWPKRFSIENLTLENMVELLNLQHALLYHKVIYGLETLRDTYLDKKNDECFAKVTEICELAIRKNSGIKLYDNGYNMNLINVHSLHRNISTGYLRDD